MTMASPEQISDYLFDRRKLRSKLTFWRIAAFAFLIAAAGALTWRLSGSASVAHLQPHIARISIEGLITGDRDTLKLIDDVAKSHAAAVIVSIESPGGTTSGAERLYDHLRKLSEKKPTVAVVGGMAASGGYIAAMGTERIVAQGTSLVGSIGVLFQYPNMSKLLETVGVKMEEVKSSPLKASPNPYEQTSPEARAALAMLVKDSFDWFKGLVRERRQLEGSALDQVTDGRVFTGRQALDLKLIDQIGSEAEAIAWLEQDKKIDAHLPIRDWKRRRNLEGLGLLGLGSALAEAAGLSDLAHWLQKSEQIQRASVLDGLMSIWHAGTVN
jgi:protease-4